jgi:hypothetical protein
VKGVERLRGPELLAFEPVNRRPGHPDPSRPAAEEAAHSARPIFMGLFSC